MTDAQGTTEPDDELERLRREVEQLRSQVAASPPAEASATPPTATRTGVWRPIVATALIIIAALLGPMAVVAIWAHDQVGDTDRYVETVAPLASNPAVQNAVTDRITTELYDRLEIKAVTQDAIDALADRGLPPTAAASLGALSTPLSNAIRGFIEKQVGRLIRSPQFEEAWVAANREAHAQMVAVLTGETDGTVTVKGNAVQVNLAAVIDAVKQQLIDNGFALAARIPTVNAQFTILQSVDLSRAQRGFRILSTLAHTLPWLAVILLAVAVGVARNRRRALVAGALAIAASMLLLGAALNLFRGVYLDAIPPDVLPHDAAGAIYDQLAYFIRLNLRALLVLFLAVAAFAWVTGPGPAPVALRRGSNQALDFVRHGSDRHGMNTGRFGEAVGTYRTALRSTVLGIALLVYVMAAHPTGAFTLVVLACALLVLLVIELVARPSAPASES